MFLIRVQEVGGSEVVVRLDEGARLEAYECHSWWF